MSVVADAQIRYFPDTPLIDIANILGIVAVATLLCLGFRRFVCAISSKVDLT